MIVLIQQNRLNQTNQTGGTSSYEVNDSCMIELIQITLSCGRHKKEHAILMVYEQK